MKHERTIALNMTEAEAFDRAASVLRKRGFKPRGELGEISFRRNHPLATWWALNAKMLPTEVRVERKGEEMLITYEVSVSGQAVSPSDKVFWVSEFEEIVAEMIGEAQRDARSTYLARSFIENVAFLIGSLILLYIVTLREGPLWGVATMAALLGVMYLYRRKF